MYISDLSRVSSPKNCFSKSFYVKCRKRYHNSNYNTQHKKAKNGLIPHNLNRKAVLTQTTILRHQEKKTINSGICNDCFPAAG